MNNILNSISLENLQVSKMPGDILVTKNSTINLLQNSEIETNNNVDFNDNNLSVIDFLDIICDLFIKTDIC